jgi:short-subunit dehydrogenase
MSAFLATKCIINKHNGTDELSIINVGATASLRGSANNAAFFVAKSALRTFSQSLAKEVALSGIYVAHLVIDGLIANERTIKLNPGRPRNRYILEESIAKEVLHVSLQNRDCWTFEWDIRTNNAD